MAPRLFFRCAVLLPVLLLPSTAVRLQAAPAQATQQSSAPAKDSSSPEESQASQRKFAFALFNGKHFLEALPLFEDLARENPDDSDVLLALGNCLLDHSVTLTDEAAGKAERIRARNILLRAKQLGNNSPLLLNLLDLAPADGSLVHDKDPGVDKAIQAGEAAFAKGNYDEAIRHYSKAFELDPRNYSAVLFIGDSYFSKKDFANAATWYERAIAVNPDAETAYRYESDMLMKNGDIEKSRTRAIQAVVADPYNQIPWRGLAQWAKLNHLQLIRVHINTHSNVSPDEGKGTKITLDSLEHGSSSAVWFAYAGKRALWRNEEFKKHFPGETTYRHTLAEETAALNLAANVLLNLKADEVKADPDLTLLKKISDEKMIEPYILLSAADAAIAQDYVAYRAQNRKRLEEYLDRFVVPPVSVAGKAQ